MKKDPLILKINIKNFVYNYFFFKKIKNKIIVAPTIKANAYGLGAKKIYNILYKYGCRNFFVATVEEGIALNHKNRKSNIYILNGIQNYNLKLFTNNNLIPIINTIYEYKRIKNNKIKFGIHIDTGLNRLGLDYKNIPNAIYNDKRIKLVISHLASADEKNNNFNNVQRKRFENIIKNFEIENLIYSIANSSGSVLSKSFLFNMVRPGIGLYGGNNKNKNLFKQTKNVITLSSKIIQIKEIKKNQYIGYNQTYVTKKNIKIAIIGSGYADGIPRKLSNNGRVYYKKEKYKIIGRISMDSFTIDITNSKHNLKVGTYIDLINTNYGIEDFARQVDTLSNEVITSIGQRAIRAYV